MFPKSFKQFWTQLQTFWVNINSLKKISLIKRFRKALRLICLQKIFVLKSICTKHLELLYAVRKSKVLIQGISQSSSWLFNSIWVLNTFELILGETWAESEGQKRKPFPLTTGLNEMFNNIDVPTWKIGYWGIGYLWNFRLIQPQYENIISVNIVHIGSFPRVS